MTWAPVSTGFLAPYIKSFVVSSDSTGGVALFVANDNIYRFYRTAASWNVETIMYDRFGTSSFALTNRPYGDQTLIAGDITGAIWRSTDGGAN
jgi:hypothetical protein